MFDPLEHPHRRYNALTGEWVLVSPHRARRPWLGQVEKSAAAQLPAYDPDCYLCPGNQRVNGERNPNYTSTYAFPNDFSSLLPEAYPAAAARSPLYQTEPVQGLCRVVCFSPRHDLSLPELSLPAVATIIRTWMSQSQEIAAHDFIRYVQVFENKGEIMGCSNPHPHSQIWASSHLPNEPAKELAAQRRYLQQQGACLLCDYVAEELKSGERVVTANDQFVALAPYWAVWPFEVMVVATRHAASLTDLNPGQVIALADILRRVTARYDNLFEVSFPYSMGFHSAPTDGEAHPEWHLHAHFYPPLLRSATIKKFMVGYEMLAMPQRDLTAEQAAERLRRQSERHYRGSVNGG